jgi:hypothetical protein
VNRGTRNGSRVKSAAVAVGRRPTAALFFTATDPFREVSDLDGQSHEARPTEAQEPHAPTDSVRMPPKKKAPDVYPPLTDQVERGWKYRVRGDGLVTVGTAASGPHMRWTFRLSEYPDDASNHAACLVAEIEERNLPHRVSKIGQKTPRHGPLWEGAERKLGRTDP